jgi:hypothetical protein
MKSNSLIRNVLAVVILGLACVAIAGIFWRQELKYLEPTPVPSAYVSVNAGEAVTLPSPLVRGTSYFLHFYNPDCPCSRFNASHIQSLIRNYQDSIRFVIIIPQNASLAEAKNKFGEDLNYLTDTGDLIARACGVYSTPQAAIITGSGKLYYRGNYNRARYCTARATNFAELSLIALINKQPAPVFDLVATRSYGCELPANEIEFF